MKNRFFAVVFATCMMTPFPAMASGIPVFDGAAAANFITQLQKLKEQIETAKSQLDAAEQQIDSATGYRGFANIFNNPDIRKLLPPDLLNVYDIASGTGYGDLNEIIERVAEEYDLPTDIQQAERHVQQRSVQQR